VSPIGRLVAPLLFAVICAVTLAVLVFSQGARTKLVVDQIELTNRVNVAKDQRATIRFRLTEDEDEATVEVIDADDATVAVLQEGEPLGDFEIHRFRWDGEGAATGSYRVRLTLASLDREIVLPEAIELVDRPSKPDG
jgi:hypothetical protein